MHYLGFLLFLAIAVILTRKITKWLPFRVQESWPWQVAVILGAVSVLIVCIYAETRDFGYWTLGFIWLGGGIAGMIIQHFDYKVVNDPPWQDLYPVGFMLGSFFTAFGGLAVRASRAHDFTSIANAIGLAFAIAIISVVFSFFGSIIFYGKRAAANHE